VYKRARVNRGAGYGAELKEIVSLAAVKRQIKERKIEPRRLN
jgi:hypothetical protein